MGGKPSRNWSQTFFSGKKKVQILLTVITRAEGGRGLSNTEVTTNLRLREGRIGTDKMGMTQIEITLKKPLEMKGTFVLKDTDV